MNDQFTETTSTSWFARIKNALSGIVFGIALVIGACVALFWNEGRAVKTAASLTEGAGIVQTIDPQTAGANLEGKLLHFVGNLKISDRVSDKNFNSIVAPQGAVKLVRSVEMYQWKQTSKSEKRKKLGGGEETVTTYSYSKEWSNRAIDSSRFKKPEGHNNPPMLIENASSTIDSAAIGAVKINGAKLSSLGESEQLELTETNRQNVKEQLGVGKKVITQGNAIMISQYGAGPSIGDTRISFTYSSPTQVSAIGAFKAGALESYETSNGRSIFMVRDGTADAKSMFDAAQSSNTTFTWIVRAAGFFAMLVGFKMIFSIVGVLGDVVPFIGNIFRFATGLAAFALTAVLSTVIIGIAWIYYRPLLGIIIIGLGLVFAVAALVLGKKKANDAELQQEATA